jgi:hypothetical protein
VPTPYTGRGLQVGSSQGLKFTSDAVRSWNETVDKGVAEGEKSIAEPEVAKASSGTSSSAMDDVDWIALQNELGLRSPPANEGWQLAQAKLNVGRSLGGYGPAQRLENGPPHGGVDLLSVGKEAMLDKLVEWGSASAADSAWRKAMGISYALTEAIVPGSYSEAALAAVAGPAISKGIAWGGRTLNLIASKSALTAWAADDLSALTLRAGAQWLAPAADKLMFNSMDRMGLVLRAVPGDLATREGRLSGSFGSDAPYVIRYDPLVPGRPDPRFSIDSLGFKAPTSTTSNGGLRSTGEFWREWLSIQPESISPSNQYLISNFDRLKVSPRVDATWIKAFPEHASYMKDVLVHHHVDFGRYAIPVPGKTHVGSGGPWHLGD